jgi:UDP-N-acetylmuramate--alanine ligase
MRAEFENHHLHFMGIGGSGMSGIARIALARNLKVSGCDQQESNTVEQLRRYGAQISIGHDKDHLASMKAGDFLVLSTAIASNHPEVHEAEIRGIKIVHRSQVLAGLMRGFRSVAVAGTHGKTTTTSMLTVALGAAGLNPSFSIGGAINRSGFNGYQGTGDIFVAEADESDGSFVNYQPYGAIITNIELDHVDHFPTLSAIEEIFEKFIKSISPGGFLVINLDSPNARKIWEKNLRSDIRIFTYGGSGDFYLGNIALTGHTSSARVFSKGALIGEMMLNVPGKHNLENALAALIAGIELGVAPRTFLSGLETFSGARRRFENRGSVGGVTIIDDYGHHPTEISATLQAARQFCPNGKIYVVFQPHRFSRTEKFAKEFATALQAADLVYLAEIYPASEDPIPGVSSGLILDASENGKILRESSLVGIIEKLVIQVEAGDLILILGAGDINSIAPTLLTELENRTISQIPGIEE